MLCDDLPKPPNIFLGKHKYCGGNVYLSTTRKVLKGVHYFHTTPLCYRCASSTTSDAIVDCEYYPRRQSASVKAKQRPRKKYDATSWKALETVIRKRKGGKFLS